MKQFGLFPKARRRNADPATSHAAAAKVEDFAENHYEKILGCLKAHGPQTFHEIAARLDMDYAKIHKRLPELETQGFVRVVPTSDGVLTRLGPSGRACRVWMAVPTSGVDKRANSQ